MCFSFLFVTVLFCWVSIIAHLLKVMHLHLPEVFPAKSGWYTRASLFFHHSCDEILRGGWDSQMRNIGHPCVWHQSFWCLDTQCISMEYPIRPAPGAVSPAWWWKHPTMTSQHHCPAVWRLLELILIRAYTWSNLFQKETTTLPPLIVITHYHYVVFSVPLLYAYSNPPIIFEIDR